MHCYVSNSITVFRIFVKRLHAINPLPLLSFLQTWHQSMLSNDSFAWDHVVVWSSDTIAQSCHVHFYNPQLYSGELFVPFQSVQLLLHSRGFY